MHKIWEYVKQKYEKERTRINYFLFLNTVVWTVTAFCIVALGGIVFRLSGNELLWNAILAAGYAGFFIGFIGGCLFLIRHTPEDEELRKNS